MNISKMNSHKEVKMGCIFVQVVGLNVCKGWNNYDMYVPKGIILTRQQCSSAGLENTTFHKRQWTATRSLSRIW